MVTLVQPTPSTSTNNDTRMLWAWMDTGHFAGATNPQLAQQLATKHQAAVQHRLALAPQKPPVPPLQPLSPHEQAWVAQVAAAPAFQNSIAKAPGGFAFGRLPIDALVAFQPWVHPLHGAVPKSQQEILEWCLPKNFQTTTNINVEAGPDGKPKRVLFVTDDPTAMFNHGIGPEGYLLGVTPRLNWVQVTEVEGMYVLRNGYHRVDALHAVGHVEVPVLLTKAATLDEVVNVGVNGFFNAPYLRGLPRKPMVADFQDANLTVNVPHVKTKRVVEVRLDVSEFGVPI